MPANRSLLEDSDEVIHNGAGPGLFRLPFEYFSFQALKDRKEIFLGQIVLSDLRLGNF